jgi:hypothetical protein
MALTQKLKALTLGLALACQGCSYDLIHKDANCTMKANDEGQYHLQYQRVDGPFRPEETYVFIVRDDMPTKIVSYEDDQGFFNRRVKFDEEFDPENVLPTMLGRLKSRKGPYRECQSRLKDSLRD